MSSDQEISEIRYGNRQESRKNGKLHGMCQTWHANGQLMKQKLYMDGKLDGESKTWFMNGQLNMRQFYRSGYLEGKCQIWSMSGKIHEQYFYRNGKLRGEYRIWSEDGSIAQYQCYLPFLDNLDKICRGNRKYAVLCANGEIFKSCDWKRNYTRAFLNIRKCLCSRNYSPDFSIFIISDLLKIF